MSAIIIEDRIRIPVPEAVGSLESFRQWARSDEFPVDGRFSFLKGEVWVDMSPEQLFTHNRIKTVFAARLEELTVAGDLGYYFTDGALLSHAEAALSTEADGLFVSAEALSAGRVRWIPNADGFIEVEGTPDMVLEVVSPTSERKDKEILPELYGKAGIPEYWLVDARNDPPIFQILKRGESGYEAQDLPGGWQQSAVLGRGFRLVSSADRLGNPRYSISIR